MRKYLLSILLVLLIAYPIQARISRLPSQKPIHGSQIDWTHPLASRMLACYLLNEKTGNLMANLCDISGSMTNGAGAEAAKWSDNGLRFDGAQRTTAANNVKGLSSNVTIIYRISPDSYSGGNESHVELSDGTSNERISVYMANDIFYVYNPDDSNFYVRASWGTYAPLGSYHNIAVVLKVGQKPLVYCDGIRVLPSNDGNLSAQNNLDSFELGSTNIAAPWNPLVGNIEYAIIFDGKLSPLEIKNLHEDPYFFIKKPTNMALRWFGNTSGAPPAAGDGGVPTQVIINVTRYFCDEVYSWAMIG